MLISLDISAAYYTINYDVLLQRFQTDFGVDGAAINWLRSHLTDRQQYVKLGQHSSATMLYQWGVLQGSVLESLFFTTYVSPVGELI